MTNNATFIKKRRTQLPIKYMRRSFRSLVKRPVRVADIEQLEQIDNFYRSFIDLPLK